MNPPSNASDLSTAASSGIAWRGTSSIAIRVMRVIVFLALARILVPEQFGLVAFALVFISILQYFASGGLSQALIQLPNLTRRHIDTALSMSTLFGVIFASSLFLVAPLIADAFNDPRLSEVLQALALMPLLVGISMVPEGLLSRTLQFKKLSVRHMVAAAVSSALALVLALTGAGVWALVAQTISEAVVSSIMLWGSVSSTYRPHLGWSLSAARELATFGSKVVGFDLTAVASTKSDDFIVGSILGPFALGVYSVSYRLLTVLQETLQGVATSVAFPMFSRIREDTHRLSVAYLRASTVSLCVATPIFTYTAAAAPVVVDGFLGTTWASAAPVMTLLAVAGVAASYNELNFIYLQATNRAGTVLVLSFASAVIAVIGFIIGAQFGIVWVAAALAIKSFVFVPIIGFYVVRGLASRAIVSRHLLTLLPQAVPLAAGLGARTLSTQIGSLPASLLMALAGAVVYIVVLRVLLRETYADLMAIVRGFRRGPRKDF